MNPGIELSRPSRRRMCRLAAALLALAGAGCSGEAPSAGPDVVRDTTATGAERVRYPALPHGPVDTLGPSLRLGTAADDATLAFGDIRGIDATADGTIYVFDYQATEIRAFSPDGRFLRTVASAGEGPGEIGEANGLVIVGDSLIWVHDYGNGSVLALTLDGEEVLRRPPHVRSYGYIWSTTIDDRGRFWKWTAHSDEERPFPPEPGVTTSAFRAYLLRDDPTFDSVDSVFVGDRARRAHISRNARGGWSYRTIPFDPAPALAVDPAGGFWESDALDYRLVRRGEAGDTVLVVEANVSPIPVTDADRDGLVERTAEGGEDAARAAAEIADAMGQVKPAIASLQIDDEDRVWVRRTVEAGELPLYDVFLRDGTYVGSVRLAFEPYAFFRVRNGQLYTIVRDELDVPYVVRAPVPAFTTPRRVVGD